MHLPATHDACDLPFRDPAGRIVYFDIQAAEPGAFTVPGVVDLEIYDPNSIVESSWVYFKGDPMAGPQPGHPFDMPWDRYATNFTVDLVAADDPDTTVRNIMRPTNSSLFWRGGAPFGKPDRYSMYVPMLDRSCKYYAVGAMIYRWMVPADLEADVDMRLKLTTDEPASTHLSGLLRIAGNNAAGASTRLPPTDWPFVQDLGPGRSSVCALAIGVAAFVLAILGVARVCRSSRRIALE